MVAVRGAIDIATEVSIKADGSEPTEIFRKAIALARQGRFDKIRMGMLLDMTCDNGKKDTLLWELTKAQGGEANAIQQSFNNLVEILIVVHPQCGTTSVTFMHALSKRIAALRRDEVPWAAIGKWHLAIMRRLSLNSRHFFSAVPGYTFGVSFDLQLLKERTSELHELEQEQLKAVAAKAAREAGGGGGSKKENGKRTAPDDTDDKSDKPDKKKTKTAIAAGVTRGKAVPRPKPKADEWKDWTAKNEKGKSANGKHEDRPACWDYHHPQGCKEGDKCDFYHKK